LGDSLLLETVIHSQMTSFVVCCLCSVTPSTAGAHRNIYW